MSFFKGIKSKSALLKASEKGDLSSVQSLVQGQPQLVDQKSFYGNAPLHNAAANGCREVVEYLVKCGGADVEILDGKGKTPLWRAANNGHTRVVQWLVDHGKANVDVQDAENLQTPLHVACAKEFTDLVEYLVQHANANVYLEDESKDTPLNVAVRTGNVAIMQCLGLSGYINAAAPKSLEEHRATGQQLQIAGGSGEPSSRPAAALAAAGRWIAANSTSTFTTSIDGYNISRGESNAGDTTSSFTFQSPTGKSFSRQNNHLDGSSFPITGRTQTRHVEVDGSNTMIETDCNGRELPHHGRSITKRHDRREKQTLLGWDTFEEAKQKAQQKCQQLQINPKAHTKILKTEYRGITLKQLKEVVWQIRLRCWKERWTSTNPDKAGCQLQPEEVTLYDLVQHYILPTTEQHQCSYVEAVATKEQPPQWFVSHWWGESVLNFVTCLERHADDRALNEDTVYWVCAYAINQHEVAGELGSDPRESPFYKAMQLTEGTVSVLDRESVTYSRIWCGFEIYTALRDFAFGRSAEDGIGRYLYDVYVLVKDKDISVGLTDGIVADDKIWRRPSEWGGMHYVHKDERHEVEWPSRMTGRESSFPEESCIKALDIQLQNADASREEDKRRILNCMIGSLEDLDQDPPESHPIYNEVNGLLRAKFAVSAYRHILYGGNVQTLELVRKALSEAPLDRLEISFKACKQFQKEAIPFLESLPESLISLDLNYGMNAFRSSNEFAVGISRLSWLESLTLDCMYCPDLSCLNALWSELGQLSRLRKLRLTMFPHRDLASLDGLTEALSNLSLLSLELSFGTQQNSLGAKPPGPSGGASRLPEQEMVVILMF